MRQSMPALFMCSCAMNAPSPTRKTFFAAYLPGKLRKSYRSVVTQANGLSVLYFKQRVIHLAAARIHDRADNTACGHSVPRHRLKRRNADAHLIGCPCKTLNGGNTDSDPREGTRSVSNGDKINAGNSIFSIFKHIVHHRQKRAAVSKSAALTVLRNKLSSSISATDAALAEDSSASISILHFPPQW